MSLFSQLSRISRARKIKLFNEIIKPESQMKVLDVGSQVSPYEDKNGQFIYSYPWKTGIHAVNIAQEHISKIKECFPEIEAVVGDGCRLPWPDKYFDIVFSNAVIEHVGDFEKQRQFASEIMRVGKRWFVTTPNRWYPFEFHMRLPFVTWLPHKCYLLAGRIFSYSHVKRKYIFGMKEHDLRLMSSRELRLCFPGSRIIKHRVTFMAETLIAVGGDK